MEYDFPLFRPPSEARSLIFQVTLGCSWNRCRFCASYRTKEFRVRPFEEVERDVVEMSACTPDARKIFLADGDPMAAPTDYLVRVLDLINRRFPSLERISTYAGPTNLMAKTPEELGRLRERKLDLLYLGIETGNDELLTRVGKGATAGQIVDGGRKALQAGLRVSAFIILGLGGVEGSAAHAKDSARVVNDIDPQFLATLTLIPLPERAPTRIGSWDAGSGSSTPCSPCRNCGGSWRIWISPAASSARSTHPTTFPSRE